MRKFSVVVFVVSSMACVVVVYHVTIVAIEHGYLLSLREFSKLVFFKSIAIVSGVCVSLMSLFL